jgi:hypothetical protein
MRTIEKRFIEKLTLEVFESLENNYTMPRSVKDPKMALDFLHGTYISDNYSEAEVYMGVYKFLEMFANVDDKIPSVTIYRDRENECWTVNRKPNWLKN